MKTNKAIILEIMFSATMFMGCSEDFLEVQKPDGEPLEEYYTTKEHIEEAVIAAYDPIHWHDWGLGQYNAYNIDSEIMSDDFWVGGGNYGDMQHWHMLGNFEADANNTLSTLWTIDYSGVKRCNDAIKYLGWVELDEEYETSCEMQVRCLRVFYYNNLWHNFGNVPFYLENLTAPYTAPQLSADEVYEQLIVELEAVIDSKVLPIKWDDDNAGRVSQAMAIMMYAEMVTYQNDTERFSKALSYLKEQVIAGGTYKLNPDFAAIWATSGEWCDESIWEINYDQTISERDWGSGQSVGGMVIPTLISPQEWKGGEGWAEVASQDGWGFLPMRRKVLNLFTPDDKRIAGTVWDTTGKEYTKRDADTGLWLFKYRPYDENNANGTSSKNLNYANNYRVYRYAEALLYAAELALRTGDNASAIRYTNEVRARAGITPLTAVTLDDIFTERHKEFIGEGRRYFDLVRAEFMTDASVSSANKATGVLVPAQDEGVVGSQRTNAWKPGKKYIPIAQAELDTDPALVQNNDYFN